MRYYKMSRMYDVQVEIVGITLEKVEKIADELGFEVCGGDDLENFVKLNLLAQLCGGTTEEEMTKVFETELKKINSNVQLKTDWNQLE
jgi:hypothetical protein